MHSDKTRFEVDLKPLSCTQTCKESTRRRREASVMRGGYTILNVSHYEDNVLESIPSRWPLFWAYRVHGALVPMLLLF